MDIILNVIGAGNAGRTLAALWRRADALTIGDVRTRSIESAESAVNFIGDGTAGVGFDNLRKAALWLIATDDHEIASVANRLAELRVVDAGDVVFHLSGAMDAGRLAPLRAIGAAVASAHPVHSFSDPRRSLKDFAGSYCALEGDAEALTRLEKVFAAIGAHCLRIRSDNKVLYHAGMVMASNYLVALVELSLGACVQAGLERAEALALLGPLMRNTLERTVEGGPVGALTGPLARGDAGLVAAQVQALDAQSAELYRGLGHVALSLVRRQGRLDDQALGRLARALEADGGE